MSGRVRQSHEAQEPRGAVCANNAALVRHAFDAGSRGEPANKIERAARCRRSLTASKAWHPVGFTLIELLTVIAIIAVISAIALPAVKMLGKSNDQTQGANLVRAMLSAARSMAVSQHRMAGVAFFEENAASAPPGTAYHGANTTAMALFVEQFDQTGVPAGMKGFWYYGSVRQYLPEGIRLAALSDVQSQGNVVAEDVTNGVLTSRIIMFDANGNLAMVNNIWATLLPPTFQGPYSSYPGIFLYNKAEYDAVPVNPPQLRINWLKKNSTAVIVNGNTGGLLR
jgi:prepilin-type N-terminal cleavage/methylation domain-containing protein